MTRICILTTFAVVTAVACMVGTTPALANTFTNSNPGGTWNSIYVQGFQPSVDPVPTPSPVVGGKVYLDSFSFYKAPDSGEATNVKLAIVDEIYHDYATDPLTTSNPAVIALSSNTIADTAALADYDELYFDFGGLELDYTEDYAAVFVNVDSPTAGDVTPVLVPALTGDYAETFEGSGVYVPTPNYGGLDNYDFATSNFISGGYFSAFSRAGDANFVARYSYIPEPSSVVLAMLGMAMLAIRGRRR